jgi:hypothetical protein
MFSMTNSASHIEMSGEEGAGVLLMMNITSFTATGIASRNDVPFSKYLRMTCNDWIIPCLHRKARLSW